MPNIDSNTDMIIPEGWVFDHADEADYYLTCGCWSGWGDHRCMGGSRPSYCCCGAPDDCYCPSPSERAAECELTEMRLTIDLELYGDETTQRKITNMLHELLTWTLTDITITETEADNV